jgi:hypothetical protein
MHGTANFKLENSTNFGCNEFSFSPPTLGCMEPLLPWLSISPETHSPKSRQGSAEKQSSLRLFLQITLYQHFYWRRIILFVPLRQVFHSLLHLIFCRRSFNGSLLAPWHTLVVLRRFRHQTLYQWPKIKKVTLDFYTEFHCVHSGYPLSRPCNLLYQSRYPTWRKTFRSHRVLREAQNCPRQRTSH